jgi:two-component system NtrC family response regulator/two-component system response regulator HydG
MRKLRAALDRLAGQDVSILIRGESGTGKELVARALHERGSRRKRRFVALNCGAIPESLIDSELFGHARGAFTGATTDRPGVFVEADGGTLFLDEIGDMPTAVQARLLRVLQEGEVRPVGGNGVRNVDVRVIAATHVDLTLAVEQGRFRQDLFYRLNVVVLSVPPLRERLDDLPMLAAHFLRKHAGATPMSLSPEALDAMMSYPWPGNVRELENAIERAVVVCRGSEIGVEDLPPEVVGSERQAGEAPVVPGATLAEVERFTILSTLEHTGGSTSRAAEILGISTRTVQNRLRQYLLAADAGAVKLASPDDRDD